MTTQTGTKQPTLNLTRIFDAPRELVFKAWTEPKHLLQWWMPHGFTNSQCKIDAKPGGAFEICSDAPNFPDHWTKGVYTEVTEPEKIVFKIGAFIGDDNVSRLETVTTVIFEEYKGKTKLILNSVVTKFSPELQAAINGMEEGWNQSLQKLSTLLASLTIKK